MESVKAFGAWLWNWITVIVAAISGVVSTAFDILDSVGVVDWTAFFDAETALRVTTVTAIVKGLYAYYKSVKEA